jgi:hypothetical protein
MTATATDPSLADIGSGHSPRTLKRERPFAMCKRYLHLERQVRKCIAVSGYVLMSFGTRPRLCENVDAFFQNGRRVLINRTSVAVSGAGNS